MGKNRDTSESKFKKQQGTQHRKEFKNTDRQLGKSRHRK